MSRLALAFVLGFVFSFAYVSTSQAATVVCPTGPYNVSNSTWPCNGTSNADNITASADPSVTDDIYAKDGADVIHMDQNSQDYDSVHAGSGNDTIYADEPGDYVPFPTPLPGVFYADWIVCEGGTDTVYADNVDTVDPSCERVVRGTVP